ncbi:MAG TPA: DUF3096 domain-containing protein [Candidatus Dormibacteraeota bacterium]|jgi:hypothetical protein|nr:DUF3096 domain-containing protein [Candidatus Dormibacteraeota bacterium]
MTICKESTTSQGDIWRNQSMDVAEELSGTFKVPKALVAFLAIVTGLLILFFPYILNVLIAFFLVVWGLLKAAELGAKSSHELKAVDSVETGDAVPES